MNVEGQHYRTIWLKESDPRCVQIIDQRFLPHEFVIEDLTTVAQVAAAIREMHVRGAGLIGATAPWEGLSFGGLGLAIAVAHARWRGPRDPSRWQVEHLTSLLAAYTVGWSFILALYAGLQNATGLVVPALGVAAILLARRRFGAPATEGVAQARP